MKLLDLYFKHPIKWDYFMCAVIIVAIIFGVYFSYIEIPKNSQILEVLTDISNTSFTSTGFILTILTVIITFKSTSAKKTNISDHDSALDLFFNNDLYPLTTLHLKNCIKSLIFIAITGYFLKNLIPYESQYLLFYYNTLGLGILSLTLFRCLLILNKVLDLQNK
jgi:hypothetical protein